MAFNKGLYDQGYSKANLIKKLVSFNKNKPDDMQLLEFAELSGNFTQYIKDLIRIDMHKQKIEDKVG